MTSCMVKWLTFSICCCHQYIRSFQKICMLRHWKYLWCIVSISLQLSVLQFGLGINFILKSDVLCTLILCNILSWRDCALGCVQHWKGANLLKGDQWFEWANHPPPLKNGFYVRFNSLCYTLVLAASLEWPLNPNRKTKESILPGKRKKRKWPSSADIRYKETWMMSQRN